MTEPGYVDRPVNDERELPAIEAELNNKGYSKHMGIFTGTLQVGEYAIHYHRSEYTGGGEKKWTVTWRVR